jgi:mono/diheme cytochrome c family protein
MARPIQQSFEESICRTAGRGRCRLKVYATNCGSCHGTGGGGTGNVPALSEGPTQSATDGDVFWFITTGAVDNGMPSWASLTARQRWQTVTYMKSLKGPA